MYVVVVGAGEVGSTIAADLAEEHEVAVVDVDPTRVESLTYELDVMPVEGDGTDPATLREAGVERADLVVASTDDDETNIVTCGTVQTLADAFAIARVKGTRYLDTWRGHQGAFGVDFMVCADLETAEAIVRVVGLPAATDVDSFADGTVRAAQFDVSANSPLAGTPISSADDLGEVTLAAVVRNGTVEVASGETVPAAGDDLLVVGTQAGVEAFGETLAPDQRETGDVVVLGGSAVGYETARLLAERGLDPRLVERDQQRARECAEALPGATVLAGDATDRGLLEREHVGEADVVVSALDSESRNLLAALLAGQLGADRTVAVVESGEYVDLFETVGIDVAVDPRAITAEELTRFTHERYAENVALLPGGAEVVEVVVDADGMLAGRTIRESTAEMPSGMVVGAITRDGEYVRPRGDTVVEAGDHVVVFAEGDAVEEVTAAL